MVVTGGTGGLGEAVSAHLVDRGWRVIVPWIAAPSGKEPPTNTDQVYIHADVLTAAGREAIVAAATKDPQAPLAGLVNLVGGFSAGARVHEAAPEVLDHQLDLNVRSAYRMTQAVLPELIRRGGGSVVCVSAAAVRNPFSGGAAYIASKAAVTGLVEALSVEYLEDQIRVNALVPTVIDTPANRTAMPDSDRRGWTAPERIAPVVDFLLGPDGAVITGSSLQVRTA